MTFDVFNQVVYALDEAEQKGYFGFAREGQRLVDNVVASFSQDDVRQLGDNIVLSAQLELVEDDPGGVRRAFLECFAQKRVSQPLGDRSAGCIFKNPTGRSAGALIDQAGLKGANWGGAQVSERHANFIVARRGATATDVLHLIDLIRERVRSAFSTELEVEVDIWRPVGVRR